jgi:hypothetical protein
MARREEGARLDQGREKSYACALTVTRTTFCANSARLSAFWSVAPEVWEELFTSCTGDEAASDEAAFEVVAIQRTGQQRKQSSGVRGEQGRIVAND